MMNFARTEHVDAAAKLNEEMIIMSYIDHMLVQQKEAEPPRLYLGASSLGHPLAKQPWDRGCDRATWFSYHKYPPMKSRPPALYRMADMGHAVEDMMAKNLRAAGFTVLTEDAQKKQFGFELARDAETGFARYQGHCDGIITDGPALIGGEKDGLRLKYPFLWESKGMKNDKWEKFKAEGLENSHPVYYGQLQQYMNFLNLYQNPALITITNRDSGQMYPEFIRFNQKHAQGIIDRASRVIDAKGPLALDRASQDWEKSQCKFCDFKDHCKAAEANRPQANAGEAQTPPSWIAK